MHLTTNHYLANSLFDNPHESIRLYLVLLLQELLIAHDDRVLWIQVNLRSLSHWMESSIYTNHIK